MLIFWSPTLDAENLSWLFGHMVFCGIYKSLLFWYDKPGLRSTYHLVKRRQCLHLNNISSVFILFPLGIYMRHHHKIVNEFFYLHEPLFYVLAVLSGVLCFSVNNILYNINEHLSSPYTDTLHIISKYVTLAVSMHAFLISHSLFLWASLAFCFLSDLIFLSSMSYPVWFCLCPITPHIT